MRRLIFILTSKLKFMDFFHLSRLRSFLLDRLLFITPYFLTLSVCNGILTLSYKSKPFGLSDIENSTSFVLGNGRATLLDSVSKGILNYSYLQGINVYTLNTTITNSLEHVFFIKGSLDTTLAEILTFSYTNFEFIQNGSNPDWVICFEELLSNIIYYTNRNGLLFWVMKN